MKFSAFQKRIFKILSMLMVASLLIACSGEDKPFSLVGDTNAPQPGSGNPDTSATPPPGDGNEAGCYVNFTAKVQLSMTNKTKNKISHSPEITLSGPIPIKVDGNNFVIAGKNLPQFTLTGLSSDADLQINGDPNSHWTGTYDPATGKINFTGVKFLITLLQVGTTNLLTAISPNPVTFPDLELTTDHVSKQGKDREISEDGQPLKQDDKSLKLVTAIKIPISLPGLGDVIGDEALSGSFTGNLDNLPANCVQSGGTSGGGTSGGTGGTPTGPSDFSISDGATKGVASLDFGSTPVIVTATKSGKAILDCTEAGNRGLVIKNLTITNTSTADLKVKIPDPADTDTDKNDPLCSGESEFVRGSITTAGAASCEKVTVAGRDFLTGTCTIPKDDISSISFPVMYVPFNYVAPEKTSAPAATPSATPGATPPVAAASSGTIADGGKLTFEYGDGKTFELPLTGKTLPDTRDALSIAKKKDDNSISAKQIKNGGVLKIALDTAAPTEQKLVLLNKGNDSWENVTFKIEDGTNFKMKTQPASPATLGAQPLDFSIEFDPSGGASTFNDKLDVTLTKAGTTDQTTIKIDLVGTVGIPKLSGNVQLQIDYLTALIDYQVPVLVESLDFRNFLDQAPPAQTIAVADVAGEDFQELTFNGVNFDPLNSDKKARMQSLRILNAQGSGLKPGDDSSLCNEADPIKGIPYKKGDCAYFYFNISSDPTKPGIFDEETGDLVLPELNLQVQNPYHDQINSWPASNPNGNPKNILDTDLTFSLTTMIIDKTETDFDGQQTELVPDSRVTNSELNISSRGDALGKDCPADFLTNKASKPHLRCYLSTGNRYLQGRSVTPHPGKSGVYDVILVGVGQYQPGSSDPNMPFFLGTGDGSKMYIAIQGRLCAAGVDCAYSQ